MNVNAPLRLLAAAACCLASAACTNEQRGAEDYVRQTLKDPDSARFGDFYYNAKTKKACLTTNAKNSMGGYTGNQQVHLSKGDNGWEEVGDPQEDEAPSDCKDNFADKS